MSQLLTEPRALNTLGLMPIQKQINPQFEVQAKVTFDSQESRIEEGFFFFRYQIEIVNKGSMPAQLMSRHWVITDATGKVEEVRGAGVVGVQPKLNPGQSFQYESACPLGTPSGSMTGSYQMMTESGEAFDVQIPEFYLVAPTALH